MGCNPLTVKKKLTKINFVDDLYKEMFKINSTNIALENTTTTKHDTTNDHKNFFELRTMLAESIYGIRTKSKNNEYLVDKFSHMFKEHLVKTKSNLSNNSDSDILETPIIEILDDLKSMGLYDIDLKFNRSSVCSNQITYEDTTVSHHSEFFTNLIDGIAAYNKQLANLNIDDNKILLMPKMVSYTDLFIRLELPLLRDNIEDHLKELILITNNSLKSIYKIDSLKNEKNIENKHAPKT